jgi:hypothetical protein
MAASKYDFSIEQGSSFKIIMTFKKDDGSLLDITGWCARLTWRTNTNVTQVFTSNNVDYSVYKFILDEENSRMTLLIPASTTNNFNFNSAKYDLELQSPDTLYSPDGGNYTMRVIFGVVTIIKRFSRTEDLLDCDT